MAKTETTEIKTSEKVNLIVSEIKTLSQTILIKATEKVNGNFSLSFDLDNKPRFYNSHAIAKYSVNFESGKTNITFKNAFVMAKISEIKGLSIAEMDTIINATSGKETIHALSLWLSETMKANKDAFYSVTEKA